MPPIGYLMGGVDFSQLFLVIDGSSYATMAAAEEAGAAVIKWGVFLNSVIAFLIVAWILFLIIRAMNRAQAAFAKEEEAAEEASDEAEIEVEEEVNVDEASEEDAELAPGEKSGNLFVDRMSSGDDGASFVPALQLQDHSEDKPARPEPEPRKPAKTGEPLYLQYMKNFGKDD